MCDDIGMMFYVFADIMGSSSKGGVFLFGPLGRLGAYQRGGAHDVGCSQGNPFWAVPPWQLANF